MIRAVPVATASFCVWAVLVLVNLNSAACLQQRAVEQELAGAAAASSGPWAILARHGEKDEDNVSDIDLNQRGRIRASAMGALLYPAPGTSRKLYTAPLPACLQNSIPIALAAQVPDVHKSVRRCKETAEIIQAQADISGATGITLAPFGIMDGDALAAWVWKQSLSKNGQMDSISVYTSTCICVRVCACMWYAWRCLQDDSVDHIYLHTYLYEYTYVCMCYRASF